MWLQESLLQTPLDSVLSDNILVTCNAAGGTGGLVLIENADQPNKSKTTVIDRLGTTGFCLEPTYYVRSILLSKYMMLIAGGSWGATWVVPSNDASDVHDLLVFEQKLYAVSTGTNQVLIMSIDGKIENRLAFPGGDNAWHINCLDVWDGRIVASAFGRFDSPYGWQTSPEPTGIVFDLQTREILWDQLFRPHSPKQVGERYFVCDSGHEQLLVKTMNKKQQAIRFAGYWPRGIAFSENQIYVGLSKKRDSGEDSADELGKIAVLDKTTLEQTAELPMPFKEIYNIVLMPKG